MPIAYRCQPGEAGTDHGADADHGAGAGPEGRVLEPIQVLEQPNIQSNHIL